MFIAIRREVLFEFESNGTMNDVSTISILDTHDNVIEDYYISDLYKIFDKIKIFGVFPKKDIKVPDIYLLDEKSDIVGEGTFDYYTKLYIDSIVEGKVNLVIVVRRLGFDSAYTFLEDIFINDLYDLVKYLSTINKFIYYDKSFTTVKIKKCIESVSLYSISYNDSSRKLLYGVDLLNSMMIRPYDFATVNNKFVVLLAGFWFSNDLVNEKYFSLVLQKCKCNYLYPVKYTCYNSYSIWYLCVNKLDFFKMYKSRITLNNIDSIVNNFINKN